MKSQGYLTRPLAVVSVAALAVLLASVASLALGAQSLSPYAVWHALASPTGVTADVIIRDLRIPRTVLGLVVGGSLGVAGALMQAISRNPLADPGLFGVSAGAALFVVVALRVGLADGITSTIWWALVGAILSTALVFLLAGAARGRSGPSPVTLAVVGMSVSAGLAAVTSAIVLLDARTLDGYRFWAVGSLAGRGPEVAGQILPFAVAGMMLAFASARGLDLVALGDDMASGLGLRVARLRLVGVASIGLLTAAGVAACGPIAFLGLMVGHAARALVGPRHLWLLPLSGLLGAAALLVADVVGRLVAGAGELQAGVVLGLVGGPLFVILVGRRRLAL